MNQFNRLISADRVLDCCHSGREHEEDSKQIREAEGQGQSAGSLSFRARRQRQSAPRALYFCADKRIRMHVRGELRSRIHLDDRTSGRAVGFVGCQGFQLGSGGAEY